MRFFRSIRAVAQTVLACICMVQVVLDGIKSVLVAVIAAFDNWSGAQTA